MDKQSAAAAAAKGVAADTAGACRPAAAGGAPPCPHGAEAVAAGLARGALVTVIYPRRHP
eukprot:CAMPEP_0181373224 /NCGR_PEP_ID=MMETSP1106-20121128/15249_1 /TAXON_ID=81844 /ORGANISM="Mantoniella antarctica, Strain SL-175" /LENGTH=59 /DNA_ID=CAMNT_0023490877 /DNA_START=8 /DNA_END=187 /DNA_ORIENTATION=+